MKLRRLKILKFRNVQPGTELEFNDGYNVLLGQNGSGKTTLLRLITSVLRGDFTWLEKEAFALEADLLTNEARAILAIRNGRRIDAPSEESESLPHAPHAVIPKSEKLFLDFDLRIIDATNQIWEVHWSNHGTTYLLPGQQTREESPYWDPSFPALLGMSQFLSGATHGSKMTEQATKGIDDFSSQAAYVAEICRFDESLELFSGVTGRRSMLGKEEYGHITGKLKTRRTRGNFVYTMNETPVPHELTDFDALKKPNFESPSDTLILKHDQAPFLAKVTQMLGYVGAEIKLDLLGKEVTEQQQTIEYGNLRFLFHGRDGSIVTQDHLSYGQKRLLTFFYYLACNPHVVVADELVNGLHHAWIAECIREMGDRQVFVTSQNPILLDHLGFDSAEQVRRTFITCQAKPEGVRDRITWANMSKKNADAFYRAYKVGAQHVGEILRTKGLW